MHIGSVLLQPQRIERAAAANAEQALLDDVLGLSARVMADKAQGGRIADVMGEAVEAMAARILEHLGDGLQSARQRFRNQFQPFIDRAQDVTGALSDSDNPVELADSGLQILIAIADALKNLSIDQLRPPLNEVVNVIEDDLGLTPAFLEQQVLALIDDIITRLRQATPETDEALRENRLVSIGIMRRIKRHLRGQLFVPQLNAEDLAASLLDFLRRSDIAPIINKISCVGAGIGTGLRAGEALVNLVPYTGFGLNTLGAADGGGTESGDEFCWYPTWLLGNKDRPAYFIPLKILLGVLMLPTPEDRIWINRTTNTVTRRNILRGNEVWPTGAGIDWNQVPVTGDPTKHYRYTFPIVNADAMEKLAYHSSWIIDAGELIMHAVSIEEGDWVSNALFMTVNTGHGIYKVAAQKPLPQYVMIPARAASYLGGSFQGIHTQANGEKGFKFWLTLFGTDAFEANLYYSIMNGARDTVLSFFTLLNYDGPVTAPAGADTRPENRKEVSGIVGTLVGLATSQVLIRAIPKRDYVYPFADVKTTLGYWIGGGLATAVLAGTVATVIAESIARAVDLEVWGWQLISSSIQVLASYWPSLYLGKEGDTEDGKYNPAGDTPALRFAGYSPDRANSPYKLPYEKGKSYLCSQGNQGMWSHNNYSSPQQVYAYDLALDQGDEVLASRPGIVCDYFDWVPDNENINAAAPTGATIPNQTDSDNWNFVLIRHDEPGDPLAGHDLDEGGVAVTTYAMYGHGRNGSVRSVFNARGVADADIIGTRVLRGQVIMLAGSTGNSLHNHLHIDVRPGPAPPAAGSPPVLARGNLFDRTIPFIFRDVTGEGGVPHSFNYYTSDNEKI